MQRKQQTLADFITFKCDPQTIALDIQADILERKIAAAVGIDEKHKQRRILSTFCVVYMCTLDVSVHLTDRTSKTLGALCEAWQRRNEMSPAELWDMRATMPHTLWAEWFRQWDNAQRLFELDPAEVPDDMLSTDQKEELKDPQSPLASAAEASLDA